MKWSMEGVQGVGSLWTGGQCFQLSLSGELRPGSDHNNFEPEND